MGDDVRLVAQASVIGFGEQSLKIFHGLTEHDLAELYSSADAFCFPSTTPRECMGMAMKEAMAIGLPIAAYDAGGISEAIEDGVNGYLVPVGDKAKLADAISKIMKLTTDERLAIARANVEKARRLFNIAITAKKMYDEMRPLFHSEPHQHEIF
jgi:glycosyltransferase involved in cell wall biosynthesis